jgi:transcriptional regulator of aromatic amino acid metabolism
MKLSPISAGLFFRLNIIPIKIPTLRERMEDISLLVEHFVEKFNYKMGKTIKEIAPEVFDIFIRYPYSKIRLTSIGFHYIFQKKNIGPAYEIIH